MLCTECHGDCDQFPDGPAHGAPPVGHQPPRLKPSNAAIVATDTPSNGSATASFLFKPVNDEDSLPGTDEPIMRTRQNRESVSSPGFGGRIRPPRLSL